MATAPISNQAAPVASTAASLGVGPPAPVAGQQSAPAGNAAVSTGYDPTPVDTSVSGGGAVSDLIGSAATKFAVMASSGMKKLEEAMNGDIAANGGQLDAAKMQQYTQKMSTFEQMMALAKQIQDKQDRATQVWLQ